MADQNDQSSPIFIHSLFRAGSTYLFQVFRRSEAGYWCYQEPIHEVALFSRENLQNLIQFKGEVISHLRHPILNESYFYELHEVAECWREVLTKEIIYDDYFGRFAQNARAEYLHALIKGAQSRGRAVIQECRTASRIASIRHDVGGVHIYLWRNPWDQWWSYKVTEYFDTVNQLILNAPDHPEVVARLRQEIGFKEFHSEDIRNEIAHFSERRLSAENSYLIFYSLWCLGLLEGMSHADILLNIDVLSDSNVHREAVLHHLTEIGISGLDFSDCLVPQARYGDQDKIFFEKIEERVQELFLLSGFSSSQIDSLSAQRQLYQPRIWNVPFSELDAEKLVNDAVRARHLLRHFETREAQVVHRLNFERDGLAAGIQEVSAREQRTQQELLQLSQALAEREGELVQSRHATAQLESRLSLREAEMAGVYRSLSWRLTIPLRKVNLLAKGLKHPIRTVSSFLTSFPRRIARRILFCALRFIQAKAERRTKVARFLALVPFVTVRLRRFYQTHSHMQSSLEEQTPSQSSAHQKNAGRFRRQLELELIRRRQIR